MKRLPPKTFPVDDPSEMSMTSKILFPVDGSEQSLRALKHWLATHPVKDAFEVHVVNVQLPVDGNVRSFVNADELNAYHRAEGEDALKPARAWLDAAGQAYHQHILVGHPALMICRLADEQGMSEIVMGSHGRTGLLGRLLGSVAAEVQSQAKVPVTIVRDTDTASASTGN
jgi:nucleotide-binding universal stress UspA family protein